MLGLNRYFASRGAPPEIVIFAGKGGLGKTTSSAALAWHMSQVEGKRTLCFSTDPQASLSDIFESDIFGRGVIELRPNLYVVEIDADRRVRDYQNEVREKIKSMYGLEAVPEEIDEYIESTSAEPAMYESATYDAMAELVAAHEYDLFIFDMPPFGHGVRMVAMADILTKWVEKITQAREKVAEYEAVAATLRGGAKGQTEDAVLNELLAIKHQVTTFTDLITDRRRTAFFMVLIPEQMAIVDTERALKMFADLNVDLSGLVVNQVYPADLLQDPDLPDFLRNRISMQQGNLAEIRRKFGSRVVGAMPMFPREPKGLEMIEQAAGVLMDPPEPVQRIFEQPTEVTR